MGHYSDYYDQDITDDLKREKANLEDFLLRFNECVRWSVSHNSAPGIIGDELAMIITKIQSRLYELRNI